MTNTVPFIKLNQVKKNPIIVSPSEIIKVVKEEVMNRAPINTTYFIKNICFRTYTHEMTGKSAGAQKAPPLGTPTVVTSSLTGATTTPPPPAKPTSGPPGGPTKAPTPSRNTGGNKTDKSGGKLKIDEGVQNSSNSKGKNKESKSLVDSTDKPGNPKGHVKISLQENLFGDTDPP